MRFPKIPNPFEPKDFVSGLVCSNTNDGGDQGGSSGGGGGDSGGISDEARELIIRTVNASVTSQLGRKLPQAIATGMSPINEKLDKLIGAGSPPAPPPAPGGNSGTSPEIRALLDKQKGLEGQLKAEREAREEAAKAARNASRDSRVKEVLAKAGVEPLRMRGALAEVGARIKMREDGTPFYQTNERGYDEDFGLEEGIGRWAATDVGKSYLAPKQVQGSGASQPGRGSSPRPGAAPTDPAVAKAQRIEAARKKLRSSAAELLGGSAAVPLGSGGAE